MWWHCYRATFLVINTHVSWGAVGRRRHLVIKNYAPDRSFFSATDNVRLSLNHGSITWGVFFFLSARSVAVCLLASCLLSTYYVSSNRCSVGRIQCQPLLYRLSLTSSGPCLSGSFVASTFLTRRKLTLSPLRAAGCANYFLTCSFSAWGILITTMWKGSGLPWAHSPPEKDGSWCIPLPSPWKTYLRAFDKFPQKLSVEVANSITFEYWLPLCPCFPEISPPIFHLFRSLHFRLCFQENLG